MKNKLKLIGFVTLLSMSNVFMGCVQPNSILEETVEITLKNKFIDAINNCFNSRYCRSARSDEENSLENAIKPVVVEAKNDGIDNETIKQSLKDAIDEIIDDIVDNDDYDKINELNELSNCDIDAISSEETTEDNIIEESIIEDDNMKIKVTYNHYIMTLDSTEDNIKYDLIETTNYEFEESLNGYSIENTYTNSELNRDYVRPVSYIGDVFDDNFDGSNSTSVIEKETVINVYWKRAKCRNVFLTMCQMANSTSYVEYRYSDDYINETLLTGMTINTDRFDYSKVEHYGISKKIWIKSIENQKDKPLKYHSRFKKLNSKDIMNEIDISVDLVF